MVYTSEFQIRSRLRAVTTNCRAVEFVVKVKLKCPTFVDAPKARVPTWFVVSTGTKSTSERLEGVGPKIWPAA